MKTKTITLAIATLLALTSCSDQEQEPNYTPQTFNVSGKVEKGPFVSGSTITIQPMNQKLQVLGSYYAATLQDNLGNFSFGSKSFEAPFAELTANGYFFNEVSGELSQGTLNLRALANLANRSTVNVNLLTHLTYQRIQTLVGRGIPFDKANQQAQQELFTAFGLQQYAHNDVSTYSITAGTDESAALIAISSLLLADRSEAALTEFLAQLCREFAQHGTLQEGSKQQLAESQSFLASRLTNIHDNIIQRYADLGLDITVKDLAYFFDWDHDGIAGNEILQDGQEVTLTTTSLDIPNQGGTYTIGIQSPVPLYLSQVNTGDGNLDPEDSVSPDLSFSSLYDQATIGQKPEISLEKTLDKTQLILRVNPLMTRDTKSLTIPLYDFTGQTLAEVHLTQAGNPDLKITVPQLGYNGSVMVLGIYAQIAEAYSTLNVIEQHYHYNPEAHSVTNTITPYSNLVSKLWTTSYNANNYINMLKDADAQSLNVYQDHLNVLSALLYYPMTVAWGDVPYIPVQGNINDNPGRTPQQEILDALSANLNQALQQLENKRNQSLKCTANDLLFVSQDVAHILLAHINLYQGRYNEAQEHLHQVIQHKHYNLDASNYNNRETISQLYTNGSTSETILAFLCDNGGTRGNITIAQSNILPFMTYTDVLLSYAECLAQTGNTPEAQRQLAQVIAAKNIKVADAPILQQLRDVRQQLMLYTNTNFAFFKRTHQIQEAYGIQPHQELLPLPQRELDTNPNLTQNPGY